LPDAGGELEGEQAFGVGRVVVGELADLVQPVPKGAAMNADGGGG
jgi:hypothetical protein